jgi:hypothetical protein
MEYNNWDRMMRPGPGPGCWWYTSQPPRLWEEGDRVFMWESAPGLRLMGLGEIAYIPKRKKGRHKTSYRIRFLTRPLTSPPLHIEILQIPVLKNASFLKSGPAQSVQSLKENEARALFAYTAKLNPEILKHWRDLGGVRRSYSSPKDLDLDRGKKYTYGGGFGSDESNRQVEQAAVRVVKDHYKRKGWTVRSVEAQKDRGYDLLCTLKNRTAHVEVKGIKGTALSFVITQKERENAEKDRLFCLYAVTEALNKSKRKLQRFTGQRLLRYFRFDPISFYARPVRGESVRPKPLSSRGRDGSY